MSADAMPQWSGMTGEQRTKVVMLATEIERRLKQGRADADTLARVRAAIEPHMQAQGWQCPCCAAVHNAIKGEQK